MQTLNRIKRTHFTLLFTMMLTAAACDSSTEGSMATPDDGAPMTSETRTLELAFEGLEALGEGYVYEGWIIVDGMPVSSGRFIVDDEGMLDPASFEIDTAYAEAATTFVLTIEPAEGDDPAPSHVHVLGGDFTDGATSLTIDHAAALGDSFADATGSFILETPSSAEVAEDHHQGVWWLEMTEAGPAPSLNLPELPDGWVYEGWVVGADGPVSTGRFTAADAEDTDGAGPYAGPDGAPPFPGQDFIDPAMSLIGATVVISVEPQPDDSPAPFALKPLVLGSVADSDPGVSQVMDNHADMVITGSAWFAVASIDMVPQDDPDLR